MSATTPDGAWREWRAGTDAAAQPLIEEALAAGDRLDVGRCVAAAYAAAVVFTQAFLQATGARRRAGSSDLMSLIEAAAGEDQWFARVRNEAALLASGALEQRSVDCEHIVDAMKEIRLLSQARAGGLLGFSNEPRERNPTLRQFVVHSTIPARAGSIFEHRALYSFNQCVNRRLLSGPAVGVRYLLDPRRCLDFVMFHLPDHRFHAGEKVANSQRKGRIDEDLTKDYQPSVRLFFLRDRLQQLPGQEEDGVHEMMVRDAVSLQLLSYAIFPDESCRSTALTRVRQASEASSLDERCVASPADCRGDPETYVRATNQLVIDLEPRR